jgi:hypothetical protein
LILTYTILQKDRGSPNLTGLTSQTDIDAAKEAQRVAYWEASKVPYDAFIEQYGDAMDPMQYLHPKCDNNSLFDLENKYFYYFIILDDNVQHSTPVAIEKNVLVNISEFVEHKDGKTPPPEFYKQNGVLFIVF